MTHAQRRRLLHVAEVCLAHGPHSVPMLIGECMRLEQWLPTVEQVREAMGHLVKVGRAEWLEGERVWRVPAATKEKVPVVGESHAVFAERRTRELGWGTP